MELSVQSLGDSEHWFKNQYFGAEDEDTIFENEKPSQKVSEDPEHGWIDGHQVKIPSAQAIMRLFQRVELRFPEELPEVHAVTSLILRRQVRRRFPSATLQLLLHKLPQLKCIIYEPWRIWRGGEIQRKYDRGTSIIMTKAAYPPTPPVASPSH